MKNIKVPEEGLNAAAAVTGTLSADGSMQAVWRQGSRYLAEESAYLPQA